MCKYKLEICRGLPGFALKSLVGNGLTNDTVSPPFLTTNCVYWFLCNSEKIVINSVKKIKLVLRV